MRFMVMHKVERGEDEHAAPSEALVRDMGKLIQESLQKEIMLDGAGLRPREHRIRLSFRSGQCTVKQGPYEGSQELLARFAMIKVNTTDEAVQWAHKYARLSGDVELELGLVVEGWDLTGAPRPPNAPLRYLILHMADPKTEAGERADLSALLEEMKQAGVLQGAEELAPSAKAVRLRFKAGKRTTVLDGPFAESKELLGGFCLLALPGREEALAWADRYGAILGDVEVDVRPLYPASA